MKIEQFHLLMKDLIEIISYGYTVEPKSGDSWYSYKISYKEGNGEYSDIIVINDGEIFDNIYLEHRKELREILDKIESIFGKTTPLTTV